MPTLYQSNQPETPSPAHPNTAKEKPFDHEPKFFSRRDTMRMFTQLAVNPQGVRFETQEAEEKIILFMRQHFIVNIPWIVITAIMFVTPKLIFPFISQIIPFPVTIPWGYAITGILFWYLATFGFALSSFISWYFNIYIVTNERVVDIDFLYLLYKEYSEAELSKIQDMTYNAGGILATVFNYGNLSIKTAGDSANLTFEKIPYPQMVVETIRELLEDIP